jgi:nickel/cobalt transporter (NiCoT) family protein
LSPHVAFWAIGFSVFVLGLRHGADPDHLAAIDNLTRNGLKVSSRLARFAGTLFAGGHSIMVLAIAGLAGLLGVKIAVHRDLLETVGTWVSIFVLFGLGAFNIGQLIRGASGSVIGFKAAALPTALRRATTPLAAIPIGVLFGLGFDTSSQIAAYSLAFSNGCGLAAGLAVGCIFSLGMAVTDTLDSMLVHHLCTRQPSERARAMRAWIFSITVLSFGVGGYEMAQMVGWRSPIPDLAVSAFLIVALLVTFSWTYADWLARRRTLRTISSERWS